MHLSKLIVMSIVGCALASGCGKEDPPHDPAPPGAAAESKAPSDGADTTGNGGASELAAQPAKYPEDFDIDPDRDPQIRARAKELNAISPQEVRHLKPGDEVIVLVRGDRGGGTIYGSGPYTLDSSLRKAVVHNGALKDRELGLVRMKVLKHPTTHPSVPANGIVPTAWGEYHTSYTIEKVE
jgi:hypothetical protein